MITKLYIDNFRCFSNFELELDRFHLFLGANGSGKSSVFDVLSQVRGLLSGQSIRECGLLGERTAWDDRPTQDVAVEMREGDDPFRYELRVKNDREKNRRWIVRERLCWRDEEIYLCEEGAVHLHRSREGKSAEIVEFPFDSSRSFIPTPVEGPGFEPLSRFRLAVRNWVTVKLVPSTMGDPSIEEAADLEADGENFSSWYRYLTQAHPEVTTPLVASLQEVIPGLEHLLFQPSGDVMLLQARFSGMRRPLWFHQLSDGQRALIALYTILHAVPSLGYSLFIDEPDNYVTLREIQPWLLKLDDLCREHGRQAILISHHPEIINLLVKDDGIWFTRPDNEHVIARRDYPMVDGLTAAETMARGWDDE